MGKLAYIYHPTYTLHDPGAGHPECPARLKSIQSFLEHNGFLNRVEQFQPEAADRTILGLVHLKSYLDLLDKNQGIDYAVLDAGDTIVNQYSVDAALLSAGAAVKAVDLVSLGGFDKAFAAVRPPGHHAEAGQAMGFCLINNIAVAAAYALHTKQYRRVLIIDWDVHHGNGTQHIFYDRNDVFYLSLHRYPFYPGTGKKDEIGTGDGQEYTMNIPLNSGMDDTVYINQLDSALVKIEKKFEPDLILISAGFDAHEMDPLGGMQVTDEGYYKMTELAARFAQKHCAGKIISLLEGGYNLSALASSVHQHLNCLLKH